MGNIALAAAIMLGLGLLFALILALAYRFLRVAENPKLEEAVELLPGSNCGACGEPGCRAFAETLVEGESAPSGCTVSSPEGVERLADFLGVDPGAANKVVARLLCAGGRAQAKTIAEYEGFDTCGAAAVVASGGKGCSWGCLGLGDCQIACDFDAIHMNANGLPVVDVDKCTACNDCVEVCPKDLFELRPITQPLVVQCKTPLAGEEALALCAVACDACGRCAQDATDGLITMEGNLPVVHPEAGIDPSPTPTFRCPTRAIQWVPAGQFEGAPRAAQPAGQRHG
ncbi:MAG: RnfABCDGE type electron transport complex subunit B [Planctomycetota bacterium]|jgi:RnfABCDGE-type electron transport complex B subunit